jgi:two-component system sensor histidine kinase TtrS
LEAQVVARTAGLAAARERLQEEINERTMVEQREKQLLADLAHVARMHTLGEMASSLAHELNQPLGAMLAEADAARQRLRQEHEFDGTQLQASLQFIAEQALRGGQLVRRIRQFAKRAGPERTPISLTEVLGEILPLIKKDLREAGIVLSIEAPADLPRALADKTQVQQVILNLVRNAVEAMESTPEDARELTIRAAAGSQELEVAVGDTGCGLPVEQVEHPEKLFDSFVTTKKDGLGLGLAISRSILESHGGSLSARQNPGRGATFTFTLPLSSEGS